MTSMDKTPFFSIIISTRDRPELFHIALKSVLAQTFAAKEIIVILDGSSAQNLSKYLELEEQYPNVIFLKQLHRPNGHGQSYSMNTGVYHSAGRYLCFLDDDDYWTDDSYLEAVFNNLTAVDCTADVHYSNQRAVFSNGVVQTEKVWLEDLIPLVPPESDVAPQCHRVNTAFMLLSHGFAHLNCSVFERNFYDSIGGMDETIRYENDRDMYIRSIDAARKILFSTRFVSLHNIPDANKKSNMSTVSSEIDKKLYQMRVYDKGISMCTQRNVQRLCAKAKVFELKHAATILAGQHRYAGAAHYAKSALVNGFNIRWLGYTLYLIVQSWLKPDSIVSDSSPSR
jgi:glycosyltransferase involved in cell wall biosynthesis